MKRVSRHPHCVSVKQQEYDIAFWDLAAIDLCSFACHPVRRAIVVQTPTEYPDLRHTPTACIPTTTYINVEFVILFCFVWSPGCLRTFRVGHRLWMLILVTPFYTYSHTNHQHVREQNSVKATILRGSSRVWVSPLVPPYPWTSAGPGLLSRWEYAGSGQTPTLP